MPPSWFSNVVDLHESCRREIAEICRRHADETQHVKVVYMDFGPGKVMEVLQVLDAWASPGGLVIRVAPASRSEPTPARKTPNKRPRRR